MTPRNERDIGSAPGAINIEDRRALIPYLKANRLIDAIDVPSVRLLTGGISNRTVLVEPESGPAFVLKQALAKLRVASDWFSSPDRIHSEALGIRWLRPLAPSGVITSLLFEDTAQHIIAMSAVPEPHRNWKEILLAEAPVTAHFEQYALILGQVHARSHGVQVLAETFDDRANFESLRLKPYYQYSAEQVPAARDFLIHLIEETLDQRLSLVHGDYSPKNILVREKQFVLVDHEVIHYGDPAFDVGFALTHLLGKAVYREQVRQDFLTATQLFTLQYLRYVASSGFGEEFEARACRHTIACLLARIVGRSPLDYLTNQQCEWQKAAALRLMANPPRSLLGLIEQFMEGWNCRQFFV